MKLESVHVAFSRQTRVVPSFREPSRKAESIKSLGNMFMLETGTGKNDTSVTLVLQALYAMFNPHSLDIPDNNQDIAEEISESIRLYKKHKDVRFRQCPFILVPQAETADAAYSKLAQLIPELEWVTLETDGNQKHFRHQGCPTDDRHSAVFQDNRRIRTRMNTTLQTKIRADIAKLDNLTSLPLPASGSWPESVHQFDAASINALKMALAARRPLLLYGDPGTGKSQLARAAAIALGRMFVYDVVNAHTESQDLLWRFDAVGRLAEAQSLQGLPNCTLEERQTVLDTKRYISPGPLWWALCWETANTVYQDSQYRAH